MEGAWNGTRFFRDFKDRAGQKGAWPVIAFEYCFHFSVLADIHGLDTSPLSASLVENKCCTPSKRERKPLSSFGDRLWQLFPPSIYRRKYLKWVFLHLLSIWCNKYSLESVVLKNYGPIQSLGSHTSAQDAILSSFDVIHHDGNWKQNFYGLLDIFPNPFDAKTFPKDDFTKC